MRISDWSSDVCSSDLLVRQAEHPDPALEAAGLQDDVVAADLRQRAREAAVVAGELEVAPRGVGTVLREDRVEAAEVAGGERVPFHRVAAGLLQRSEEHTSELQSLMRISYAVFCLKQKKRTTNTTQATSML